MISTLKELKEFLESKQIPIKSYNGWQLVIGKSTWGMAHDVLYCNREPVTKKEILTDKQFLDELNVQIAIADTADKIDTLQDIVNAD